VWTHLSDTPLQFAQNLFRSYLLSPEVYENIKPHGCDGSHSPFTMIPSPSPGHGGIVTAMAASGS
jgi:hypothetical protein